ncbi:MAG: hypothetical protein ACXVBF_02875, partial [Flavisolibacter sp.]
WLLHEQTRKQPAKGNRQKLMLSKAAGVIQIPIAEQYLRSKESAIAGTGSCSRHKQLAKARQKVEKLLILTNAQL